MPNRRDFQRKQSLIVRPDTNEPSPSISPPAPRRRTPPRQDYCLVSNTKPFQESEPKKSSGCYGEKTVVSLQGCASQKVIDTCYDDDTDECFEISYDKYTLNSRDLSQALKMSVRKNDASEDDSTDGDCNDNTNQGYLNARRQRRASHVGNMVEQSALGSSFANFRRLGKNMALEERYENAIRLLHNRGQTQESVLRLVQNKLSERVNSLAQQRIKNRKAFEYFDMDKSRTLDELEFRQFLELSNCYIDEVQSLALFAYFDDNRTGSITWSEFESNCMVKNPRGGTAILPKAIIRNYC